MSKFAFLLGRHSLISLAELEAVLPQNTNFLEFTPHFLVVETDLKLDQEQARQLINQLGGSIRIVQIDQTLEGNAAGKIPKELSKIVLEHFQGYEGKAKYALFVKSQKPEHSQLLKSSLLETKKVLKNAEISSRFINNNFQNAEIAAVKGENILNRGGEFCALAGYKTWYLGKTLAIQDIDAYSTRDYERPERDARVGMLPPKLAQIMINLTGQSSAEQKITATTEKAPSAWLYDPFCGLGTVLMEGLLMHFNVVGSDLSADILRKAQKNLEWYTDKIKQKNKSRFFVKDAARLTEQDLPESITAIVSETYLGPPMSQTPDQNKINEIFTEIEHTLIGLMESLRPIVSADVSIVLTLLTYRENQGYGTRYFTLDHFLNQIPSLGFTQENLLSDQVMSKFKIAPHHQKTLLYERPDQTVCRGIYKFKPV